MFGGSTNLKHIVLTGNDDESLDTDNGWNGFVQFMIIVQRALGGDNGMEMSSAGVGVGAQTNPTIANFTMVSSHSNAIRLNTGHIGHFLNGVISHSSGTQCIEWNPGVFPGSTSGAGNGSPSTYDGLGVDPTFNSVLFDCTGAGLEETSVAAALASVANDGNNDPAFADSLINGFINGPSETLATEFTPLSGIDLFFEDTDYVGAVKDTNDRWWAEWSCGLEASAPC